METALPAGIVSKQLKSADKPQVFGPNKPKEITPKADLSHLERHWNEEVPGSYFIPNSYFGNSSECVRFLEDAAKVLIPAEQYDRPHTITVEFEEEIGVNRLVEINDDEPVASVIRDEGTSSETVVQMVPRTRLHYANFVTFEMAPKFPPKGTSGPVTFEIKTAYPGEPSPRPVTKARKDFHTQNPSKDPDFEKDQKWWDKHAFVEEAEISGLWYREHDVKLPDANGLFQRDELNAHMSKRVSTYLAVLESEGYDDNRVVAIVNAGMYYDLYEDMGSQYDTEAMEAQIRKYMEEQGLDSMEIRQFRLVDKDLDELKLRHVEVDNIDDMLGDDVRKYEVFEKDESSP